MDHPIPVTFIRLIVVLPLLGAAINFLAGAWLQKTFGKRAISLVGCGVVIFAFMLAVRAFFAMLTLPPENRFMLDDLWKWFDVGGLNLDIAFWLDPLSMIMTLIITGVGGLIHIYSTGYMHDDDGYWRFFGWLNLFTFAMLVLVLGDNLWLMFVGWEGVGLCSFALIGFWYKVTANTTAGNKAFIVNRVGDLAFVIALYSLFAGLDALGHPTLVTREVAKYAPLLSGVPINFASYHSAHTLVGFVTLLMFIGATGKSAQIPLYVWLPDAMAGPTPVSALIHAATMVTAGVYMVARLNFLFSMSPFTMGVIALVGGNDRAVRGDDRHRAKRHQEGAGVLDGEPARIHVRRDGRRRIRGRRVPSDDACVLQGVPVPGERLGDSRDGRRAGHAQDGRPAP